VAPRTGTTGTKRRLHHPEPTRNTCPDKCEITQRTSISRIPMQFQRRGGRKRIVAPDGSAVVPASKPQPDGTLVKAVARAWRWQRMLDEGVYTTVSVDRRR
jgi:hypothetical protein